MVQFGVTVLSEAQVRQLAAVPLQVAQRKLQVWQAALVRSSNLPEGQVAQAGVTVLSEAQVRQLVAEPEQVAHW